MSRTRTITIDLSVASCQAALAEINAYRQWLNRKLDLICKKLAEFGLQRAEVYFAGALYDGIKDGTLKIDKIRSGYALRAKGSTVAFLEFGAGVHYPNNHPKAGELGISHGTYGRGLGANDYWWYTGQPGNAGGELAYGHTNSTITHGNPANMPMYNSAQDMRGEIIRLASEVFNQP